MIFHFFRAALMRGMRKCFVLFSKLRAHTHKQADISSPRMWEIVAKTRTRNNLSSCLTILLIFSLSFPIPKSLKTKTN